MNIPFVNKRAVDNINIVEDQEKYQNRSNKILTVSTIGSIIIGAILFYLTSSFERIPDGADNIKAMAIQVDRVVSVIVSLAAFTFTYITGSAISKYYRNQAVAQRISNLEKSMIANSHVYVVGDRDYALEYTTFQMKFVKSTVNTHLIYKPDVNADRGHYPKDIWDRNVQKVKEVLEQKHATQMDILSEERIRRDSGLLEWSFAHPDKLELYTKIMPKNEQFPVINFLIMEYDSGPKKGQSEVLFGWVVNRASEFPLIYGSTNPDIVNHFRKYWDELWDRAGELLTEERYRQILADAEAASGQQSSNQSNQRESD